ncbi:conserved Plasmodium protein, unknown function [Plasmodium relictum]|uniref:Endonuclease/exonuclease/phosphatase domain-containing protein n=1 Tax=Plasmodium relictum TaxID=85471 RepID=A0A1J1H6E2_PLARL|nr:conserved Plasmodium protein, unknown function [Plasmodium relictum]CRG99004.1 conserved Plasmodium protein, unknown function [Plasmodium relictum]
MTEDKNGKMTDLETCFSDYSCDFGTTASANTSDNEESDRDIQIKIKRAIENRILDETKKKRKILNFEKNTNKENNEDKKKGYKLKIRKLKIFKNVNTKSFNNSSTKCLCINNIYVKKEGRENVCLKKKKKKRIFLKDENIEIYEIESFSEYDILDKKSRSSLSNIKPVNKSKKLNKNYFNFLMCNSHYVPDISFISKTLKTIEIIKKRKAPVIFFQEVMHESVDLIKKKLSDIYEIIKVDDICGEKLNYFFLILVLKKNFKLNEQETFTFFDSVMDKYVIKILINPVNDPDQTILLINTTNLDYNISLNKEEILQMKHYYIDILQDKKYKKKKKNSTIILCDNFDYSNDKIKNNDFLFNILDKWDSLNFPKNAQNTRNCLLNQNLCKRFFFFKSKKKFHRIYCIKNNSNNCTNHIYFKKIDSRILSRYYRQKKISTGFIKFSNI